MCLYPKLIKNKKYTANKKNGGVIPPIYDDRVMYVAIGCGKCIECTKKKAREWKVRLNEEVRGGGDNAYFVTLTFSNESASELYKEIKMGKYSIVENEICILAVRRFLERWRKEKKRSVKHWLITELGHNGTERVHLHGLVFTNEKKEDITRIWKYGHVYIGDYVNEKTINYVVKYCTKMDIENKGYTPKILCSKGIGSKYMNSVNAQNNQFRDKDTKEYYLSKTGTKLALPIYYRNKLYNEQERERLWCNLLDKNIRYIGGVEVPADRDDWIFNILEAKRIENNRLGFGNDESEWDRKNYTRKMKYLNYVNKFGNSKK